MYSERISFWRRQDFVLGNIIFLIALGGWVLFPKQNELFHSLAVSLLFFVAFPILAIRLVLKHSFAEYGFTWGNWKQGLIWTLCGWLILSVCLVGFFQLTHPTAELFVPVALRKSFVLFLSYTAVMAIILFGIEVLFRGLLLNVWKKYIGVWSILPQAICYWGVVSYRGTPESVVVLIGIPLCAGWVMWRSRSVWFSFLFSFGASILVSSLAIIFL
ncbi:MAG: CPBP family glutamic-type intramembrane protease [Candidatus Moraniibacteriota bacterium]